jgi:hypothetical protein
MGVAREAPTVSLSSCSMMVLKPIALRGQEKTKTDECVRTMKGICLTLWANLESAEQTMQFKDLN